MDLNKVEIDISLGCYLLVKARATTRAFKIRNSWASSLASKCQFLPHSEVALCRINPIKFPS
jgi:hypothetical protein